MHREAEVLARLDHPGIARAIAFDLDAAKPYVAMQLVEGPTLAKELRRRAEEERPLSLRRVGRFFDQICRAVSYAHDNHIIHRDLKPGNIVLESSGPRPIVKVLDFGIAKLVGTENISEATTQGRVVGTMMYMSPEQWVGGDIGVESDVFALGAILLEMLTLKRAFARDEEGGAITFGQPVRMNEYNGPMQFMERVRGGERLIPSELRSDIDAKLDEIVLKALQADASQRFETVEALRSEVEGAIRVLAPPPKPASVSVPRRRRSPRRRALRIGLGLSAVVLISAGLSVLSSPRREAVEPDPEVRARASIAPPKPPAPPVPDSDPASEVPAVAPGPAPADKKPIQRVRRPTKKASRRAKAKPQGRLDSLLAQARDDPSKLGELEREIEKQAKVLGDRQRRARIMRYTRESAIAGDLAGFERAVKELERARATP
jgi:serine/threonine protein kinase